MHCRVWPVSPPQIPNGPDTEWYDGPLIVRARNSSIVVEEQQILCDFD